MDATESRSFGALLRSYRMGAGLSQEELAERAQLSRRTVSDLERGVTTAPYRDTVALLAKALQLTDGDRAELENAVDRSRLATAGVREQGSGAEDTLLATKLAIPSARGTLVLRPRLLERLRAGLYGPLTLLSAPAGSGKTTLLSAWRSTPQGKETPVAWVSLDEGDDDPTRFWRYVLTALDRTAPGVGTAALNLLGPSDESRLEAVLIALVNALNVRSEDIVLILDDYHVIEAESIHRILAYLLEHLPPCLHLLLATRADPPLPLARLRGRGEVTDLRATDFRFSVEETAAFLTTVMSLSLSNDEVAALEARTEGWIAGLQLAALSLQGRPTGDVTTFITTFTGSHRYIVDYLLDEVLLRQPEHLQRFLLHTCILDRLSAPLCAAVIEGEDPPVQSVAESQEILESLERNNVFVIALDDERRWYRYHNLFADALRQRQLRTPSMPDVTVLHRRAGTWFEHQELLEEAIDHALAGEDYDRAADLIRRAASPLSSRGETQIISGWLRALPEATLRAAPQLAILYAWLLIDLRDYSGAERYLQYAESALTDFGDLAQDELTAHLLFLRDLEPVAGDTIRVGAVVSPRGDIRAMIGAARSVVSAIHGDPAGAIAQAQAALRGLDGSEVRSFSIASIGLGLAYLGQGAAGKAAEAFRDVAVANRTTHYGLFMTLAAVGEASARRMVGAFDLACTTYDQAIGWSEEHSRPSVLVGSLHTGLADMLRERNELDHALERAMRGITLERELGAEKAERWIEWHACNLLVLARIKQAHGDLHGALVTAKAAQDSLKGFEAISFAAILSAFQAQLHLASGDLEAAMQCLENAERHKDPPRFGLTPQVFVYQTEHLEMAPIQLRIAQSRGSHDVTPVHQALVLLDQLREKAERSDFAWLRAKTLALQALAWQVLGEMPPALAALEQALALARPAGYIRLFVDEGPPVADLLRRLDDRGTASSYRSALLSQTPS